RAQPDRGRAHGNRALSPPSNPYSSPVSTFPATRLRRLRRTGALRSLVRETRLDLGDFVLPLFVGPTTEPNAQLPAMGRYTVEEVGAEGEELARLGVRAVILFGIPDDKDEE